MGKTITAVAAAALVAATVMAAPKPAEAKCWGCWAGAGLALGIGGALIASRAYAYGYRPYYYGYRTYSAYPAYYGYSAYYGYAPYAYGSAYYGTPTDINGNYIPSYGSNYGYYR